MSAAIPQQNIMAPQPQKENAGFSSGFPRTIFPYLENDKKIAIKNNAKLTKRYTSDILSLKNGLSIVKNSFVSFGLKNRKRHMRSMRANGTMMIGKSSFFDSSLKFIEPPKNHFEFRYPVKC
jgi:hypothetical protein